MRADRQKPAVRAWISHFVERPRTKPALAVALLLVLTLLVGIFLGWQVAYTDMKAIPQSIEKMRGDLSAARAAIKVARGDLQILRTRHEVDSRALELLRDESKRRTFGAAGRRRVEQLFSQSRMCELIEGHYRRLLVQKGLVL